MAPPAREFVAWSGVSEFPPREIRFGANDGARAIGADDRCDAAAADAAARCRRATGSSPTRGIERSAVWVRAQLAPISRARERARRSERRVSADRPAERPAGAACLAAARQFHFSSPSGLAGPAAHETLLLCGRVVGTEVGIPLVRLSPSFSWTRGSWSTSDCRHGPSSAPEHAS